MKLCSGCKHLNAIDLCNADAMPAVREVNPATGRVSYVVRGSDGSCWKPSAIDMRKEGGLCGPERRLYQPGLLARLFPWAFDA